MAKVEKLEDYISIIKNLYAMEGCGALRKIYYRGQSDSSCLPWNMQDFG